jgi:chemotaxis protein methyltransferase CheR
MSLLSESDLELSDTEFAQMRKLIYSKFGITLSDEKRSLLLGRLQKVIRSRNLRSFTEYISYLESDSSGKAISELINRISTNHTYFMREQEHFDYLSGKVLPELTERLARSGERDLRIWCAGCSSGEESYTLMMLIMEHLGADYGKWCAGLLATDISMDVLGVAREGWYSDERIQGLPENLKRKYFTRERGGWAAKDFLKREITFRRFNLMNSRFPFRRGFHVIFCRNVMIYFDTPTRTSLVQRFFENTTDDGHFFIGHSESLGRNGCAYKYVMPAVYRKEAAE